MVYLSAETRDKKSSRSPSSFSLTHSRRVVKVDVPRQHSQSLQSRRVLVSRCFRSPFRHRSPRMTTRTEHFLILTPSCRPPTRPRSRRASRSSQRFRSRRRVASPPSPHPPRATQNSQCSASRARHHARSSPSRRPRSACGQRYPALPTRRSNSHRFARARRLGRPFRTLPGLERSQHLLTARQLRIKPLVIPTTHSLWRRPPPRTLRACRRCFPRGAGPAPTTRCSGKSAGFPCHRSFLQHAIRSRTVTMTARSVARAAGVARQRRHPATRT